ncbi:MAG: hypothetical protein IK147_02840 [Clostridia bacterium]|nr:hypothetical protein [Clostridia bacterium]
MSKEKKVYKTKTIKIVYEIDDDWILSSETVEVNFDQYAFEIPEKAETNKYLLSIGLNIAKLRGHTTAKKEHITIQMINKE